MLKISQNKKIAIVAIAIFLVSFTSLVFFLDNGGKGIEKTYTDVVHSEEENEDGSDATNPDEDLPIYMDIVNELKDPLFVTNVEGEIQYSNDGFCNLVDLTCQKLEGKSFFDIINSKDVSDIAAEHSKIVSNGEAVEGVGPYRVLKGEKEVLLLLKAKPVLDENEKVIYVVFCVKDITEQAEELNRKKDDKKLKSEDEGSKSVEMEDAESDVKEIDPEEWIKDLYPNFEELKDGAEGRFMVKMQV